MPGGLCLLTQILALLRSLVAERNKLALENVALRHQLAVLKRGVRRARIRDSDRVFWILMRRLLVDWQDALIFVQSRFSVDFIIKYRRVA